MALRDKPSLELAERVLPGGLLRAIRHVFAQRLPGCMLVGGTALAGFYAGHRRSDDVDLFTADDDSQRATVLAVRALEGIGAAVDIRQGSAVYLRAVCRLDGHRFTVDVAAAPALFRIGAAITLPGTIAVADLDTLLMLKGAALVSRCAEKDLYDLLWILERRGAMTLSGLVDSARRFDGGANPENLLISLLGTKLDKGSCDFSLTPAVSPEDIYRDVTRLRDQLSRALRDLAKGGPPEPLGELVSRVRKFGRRG